jgi:hypothetical protein
MGAIRKLSNATGLYRLCAVSGGLTTIAAGTATAGHVFAFRWTSTSLQAHIQRLKLRWQTVTPFTAAQEMFFRCYRATGYSASHTGGVAVTLTAPNLQVDTLQPASAVASIRYCSTAALTAGTHTLDGEAFAGLNAWSQSGANNDPAAVEAVFTPGSAADRLLTLRANEGFIVRNEILMGAAGVGRLLVELDWYEL